jgi:hypothetical protein
MGAGSILNADRAESICGIGLDVRNGDGGSNGGSSCFL